MTGLGELAPRIGIIRPQAMGECSQGFRHKRAKFGVAGGRELLNNSGEHLGKIVLFHGRGAYSLARVTASLASIPRSRWLELALLATLALWGLA